MSNPKPQTPKPFFRPQTPKRKLFILTRRSLDLSFNHMGGEAFDAICGALGKQNRLVNLHVGVNNAGVQGAAALSGSDPSLVPIL
jgi:hypothetical protein